MKVYTDLTALQALNGTAAALGYFDGLHIGHRAVIGAAVNYAANSGLSAALFTFDLQSGPAVKGPELLQMAEKQQRAEEMGVRHYVCPPFSSVKGLSCEQFVETVLLKGLCAKAVFCGEDYTFGAGKSGNVKTLKALCKKHGIYVQALPILMFEGESVSSTRLRKELESGNIEKVNAMLQRPYAITLPVVHGQALARTLDVPTMNQVYPKSMQLPKSGVYATRITLNGKAYAGATGLGSRPTVNGEGISCETYISGFNGDLYGREIRVEFLKFLRETEKFASLDDLRSCILTAAKQSEEINKTVYGS